MTEKVFDLEKRTLIFATGVRDFVRDLPKSAINLEYSKQLIRSSSSVGANYIEANESLGSKDFLMRLKICRKEAKESVYWLRLTTVGTNPALVQKHDRLLNEATEITRIFTTICRKNALIIQ